jgi:hypothetical protein
MLRICGTSKTPLLVGTHNFENYSTHISLKINDLTKADLNNIFKSIEDLLKPFEPGEFIALKSSSFFEKLNEIEDDVDLNDYIYDFDEGETIQYVESFDRDDDYDDDHYDDDEDDDDYDDENDEYSHLEDINNFDTISIDAIDDYYVRFIIVNKNNITIQISSNIVTVELTKEEFISLYER